jgi:hypothetical protein
MTGQCHSNSSTSAILERRKDKARRAISTVSMLPAIAPIYGSAQTIPLTLIAATSGPAKHTSQTQHRVEPPKGACRALRMHCIRCGDVASKKSRPMDTHDATHRYLAPKTAETYPHTPSRPRHTSADANRVTMFFFHTLLLINALYRSSANVPFLARVPDTASGSTDR